MIKLTPQQIILISSLLFIFYSSTASGQTENKFATQGTKELGGSISFQRLTPVFNGRSGEATTIFSLAPYFGFFVYNGFEIGFNPAEITVINQYGNSITQTTICIAPSYNIKVGDKIFFFFEAQVGYAHKSSGKIKENGISWGGRTGAKLALTNRGLLNLSLQYFSLTLNQKEVSNRNGFNQLLFSTGWTIWF